MSVDVNDLIKFGNVKRQCGNNIICSACKASKLIYKFFFKLLFIFLADSLCVGQRRRCIGIIIYFINKFRIVFNNDKR